MIVHLDTSALVGAFAGSRPQFTHFVALVGAEHRLGMSAIALYEWLRGPRTPSEHEIQRAMVPDQAVCAFGRAEAAVAASLYTSVRRPRGRDLDLAIAACAIANGAALWTLNARDFADVPGLRLID